MSLSDDDKQWIERLLDNRLGRLDEHFRRLFDERLERLETKLLTAFHDWASPMEARQRSHT